MNDLLEVLKKGKRKHIFMDKYEFIEYLEKIKLSDTALTLDWDNGAGEEWARFLHKKYGIVYMIHAKIGIVFVKDDYYKQMPKNQFLNLEVVVIKQYDEDEWFVDLGRLKEELCEISWCASENAVNPKKLSLNDLYFATV